VKGAMKMSKRDPLTSANPILRAQAQAFLDGELKQRSTQELIEALNAEAKLHSGCCYLVVELEYRNFAFISAAEDVAKVLEEPLYDRSIPFGIIAHDEEKGTFEGGIFPEYFEAKMFKAVRTIQREIMRYEVARDGKRVKVRRSELTDEELKEYM
jgi:hypothetical protein